MVANIKQDRIVNTISIIYMIMNGFNLRLIATIKPIISKIKLVIGTKNTPKTDSKAGKNEETPNDKIAEITIIIISTM